MELTLAGPHQYVIDTLNTGPLMSPLAMRSNNDLNNPVP
jgi:hypothetical protein